MAAVLTFVAGCFVWWLRRTYGKDGTDTKKNETDIACLLKNTETLAKLEANATRQLDSCGRHLVDLEHVDDKLTQTVDATGKMASQWGDKNHREYRTPPILDALMHMVYTAGVLSDKEGRDCKQELLELRTNLESIKTRMKQA
jgi:hypothetical protein